MEKITVGLIGLGQWAVKTHVPFYSANSVFEISCLTDCNSPEEGRILAKRFGIKKYYQNYRDMLYKEEIDIVIITTPHSKHYSQAKLALEKNINVLVDKPLALKTKEAIELNNLAKKRNLLLSVYCQRRFWSEYIFLKEMVSKEKIGDLIGIRGVITQSEHSDYFSGWRKDNKLSGGGLLADSGYHIIDIILWISGLDPLSVIALASNGKFYNDAHISLSLMLENEIPVSILILRGTPKNADKEELQFFGTQGVISCRRNKIKGKRFFEIEHINSRGKILKNKKNEILNTDLTSPSANYISALRKKDLLVSTSFDAIKVTSVLEKAYKSLKSLKVENINKNRKKYE